MLFTTVRKNYKWLNKFVTIIPNESIEITLYTYINVSRKYRRKKKRERTTYIIIFPEFSTQRRLKLNVVIML